MPSRYSATEWKPHPYQERAVDFLLEHGVAALFLDPGLGKTSIVLEAFRRLKEEGVARKMLVTAPLLVCKSVWRQEGEKWAQFRDLKFALLHGRNKEDALRTVRDVDIALINPEGLPWLRQQLFGRPFPFDTVAFDELTKYKNHRADRSKIARTMTADCARRWGLTGTPAPNGYEDLFGQALLLDGGAAFGKAFTHFRDKYFRQVGFNGYEWELQPGAAEKIEERLRPFVLRMSAEDYLTLPPLVDDVRYLDLDDKTRKAYDELKEKMLVDLPEGTVTAANSAAVYSKLAQLANGAVYLEPAPGAAREHAHVHDAKLDAIEELVEELAGQQLLVAFEFHHDLDRLRARFGDDVPCLNSGMADDKLREIVRAWNAGELKMLFAHPASAGHGLNLQEGGAAHLCWFSATWNLELYDQFIRRLYRQGSTAQRIINHILVVRDTIDEIKLAALAEKDMTQERLLQALRSTFNTGDEPMSTFGKLPRQGEAAAAPRKFTPKGWGAPAKAEDEADDTQDAEQEQRTAIADKLRSGGAGAKVKEEDELPEPKKASSFFSEAVRATLEQADPGDESAPAPAAEVEKPKRAAAKKTAPITELPERAPTEEKPTLPTAEQISGIVAAFEVAVKAILAVR